MRFGRHVQLLLDDRGAGRGATDHERDDLQVLATRQQTDRLASADASLLAEPSLMPMGRLPAR